MKRHLALMLAIASALVSTSCETISDLVAPEEKKNFQPVPVMTSTGETVPVLMEGDPIEHALAEAARQLFDLSGGGAQP
jgi:hypothetical protein